MKPTKTTFDYTEDAAPEQRFEFSVSGDRNIELADRLLRELGIRCECHEKGSSMVYSFAEAHLLRIAKRNITRTINTVNA